ncbi:hypothetical protein GMA3_74 [Gordonia phage GMA3]|uniref:Uncharacterized protein n=1 Tax=Gordonia phage GMA3 TaxID=1647284 RepID=A0A0K0NKL7_9CAUD|nr:hypothetical protein AU105_gp074 [Gordonia phage GMA3]AKL88251.1 hypothetical protein GMA3_74 [Gordonia phage GMA3]
MKTISAFDEDGTRKPIVDLRAEVELEVLITGKVEVDYGDVKLALEIGPDGKLAITGEKND